MSNQYTFLDQWSIPHPIDVVWQGIIQATEYPQWWGMVYDEVTPLNDLPSSQVGAKATVTAHGRLPYRLRFVSEVTSVQPPRELGIKATGDLNGTGLWQLTSAQGGTAVSFEWIVAADKPIIKFLSPILKPLFEWNHRWTMQQGEAALIQRLATKMEA